jgi:uncharacterized protein (DUF2236 family)
MQDYGYYGPDSTTWKIVSEAVLTLAGTRAVLMQLAHPLVAIGVSVHSSYMADPLGRSERTFILGQLLTFGSQTTARQAARTINQLHTHVHGTLQTQAGAFASGTFYQARDPELLLWVHATLVDTILYAYPLFIGHLSQSEQERYYQESKTLANLLGLPYAHMPKTVDDLRRYVNDMVHSHKLAATPEARQLVRQVFFPPTPTMLRPLLHLNYYITCALLPQPIREIYDLAWSPQQQRAFNLFTRCLRGMLPYLPIKWRTLAITRRIMQQGALTHHTASLKNI